ncbi:hypothetical protein ACMUDE_19120, partial [Vibrio cholerae]|uniref:hypothetical protein n=1 Tax=Vibrio cholerae TaxID=666 RepID=UPI0039C8CD45
VLSEILVIPLQLEAATPSRLSIRGALYLGLSVIGSQNPNNRQKKTQPKAGFFYNTVNKS